MKTNMKILSAAKTLLVGFCLSGDCCSSTVPEKVSFVVIFGGALYSVYGLVTRDGS